MNKHRRSGPRSTAPPDHYLITVGPSRRVRVHQVLAGVQLPLELVDGVALGHAARKSGDHYVLGLEAELVGQHVALDGRFVCVRCHSRTIGHNRLRGFYVAKVVSPSVFIP